MSFVLIFVAAALPRPSPHSVSAWGLDWIGIIKLVGLYVETAEICGETADAKGDGYLLRELLEVVSRR